MPRLRTLPARVRVIGEEVTYVLTEAAMGFRRNGLMTVAAVTTVLVTLLMVGAALLGGVNLAHIAQILEAQVEVIAFLKDGLPAAELTQLQRAVAALPGVTAVRLVSRAEALRRLQQRLGGTAAFADIAEANPLPDSLEVRVAEPRSIAESAEIIGRQRGVVEVSFGTQVVERLMTLTRGIRILTALTALLLALVALIIVLNTIRLTVIARRTEIEIMELVGATPWFIRWPFLIEGMLQGAVAAAMTALILGTVYTLAVRRLEESLPFLPLVPATQVVLPLVGVVLSMGIGLGAAGSALAVRRFLRP